MNFFDHILTPPKAAGRHSTVGLIERLTRELAEVREAHAKEVRGYQDALQRAAAEVQEAAKFRAWFHKADAGWRAADAEVQRLQRLLNEQAPIEETAPQTAPADLEGSCFTEPAPAIPDREQEQLSPIALTLPRPVECEAADVTAETQPVPQIDLERTQAVDVAALRDAIGEGDTAVIPVVPVTPHPVVELPKLTWGVQPKQREALAAWALGTAPPAGAGASEVSAITGRLASYKVTTALEPVSEAS